MTHDPFDPARDATLGAALKHALDPKDAPDAFVAGVMARYTRHPTPTWDALAAWSRWGVAAALVAAAVALVVLAPPERDATLASALTNDRESETTAMLALDSSPGVDVLFTELDERR